jgi:hypothetical protein
MADPVAEKKDKQKKKDASDAKEAADMYRSKSGNPHESDSGILGPGEQRTTPAEEGGDTFEEIQAGVQQELKRDNPAGAEQIQEGTEDIAAGVEQLTGQPPAAIETTAVVANPFQEGAPIQGTVDRMEGNTPIVEVNGQMYNLVPVE